MGALPAPQGSGAVKAGRLGIGVEGTGRRLECLWGLVGAWWGLVAVLWAGAEECGSDGAGAGMISRINADSLLTDERPQRPDARSREVGVGHTEDFADGGGGYRREREVQF